MLGILCHQKKKRSYYLGVKYFFFYLKLNLFSVTLKSLRGKGK